jgi:hypothetical protein
MWPATVFASLLIAASLVVAGVLGRCLWQQGSRRRHLLLAVGVAAVLGMTLALLPSLPSDDIFSYIMYGRIAVLHHANPLVAVPASFPQDPFLTFVYWRNVRSVYGPIWLLVSNGVTLLAQALGGDLGTYMFLFKALGLVCHLINMVLIWSILSIIAPRRRLLGTLLYGWSPLCLLEFSASGHNDALMLTFLLGALLLLARGWQVPALAVFGLAIATKYVPVALLPFYLLVVARQAMERAPARALAPGTPPGTRAVRAVRSIWRDRRRLAIGGLAAAWRAALVLGVVFVATIPFWSGPATLRAVLYSPPAERLDNSLLEALSQPLHGLAQALLGLDASTAQLGVDTVLKIAALLAFVALWLFEFRRAKSLAGALEACGWALLWYVLVASGWFWPWYVTWLVVLVALLPWSELSVATLLLAGGVLTLYAFKPANNAPLYGWRALFEFGPALIYLLWFAYRRRRQAVAQSSASGLASGSASGRASPPARVTPVARPLG